MSLNNCFIELSEGFPRDSKTSSNQPRLRAIGFDEFYCILKYYRCMSFKNSLLIHNPIQEFANQNDATYIETSAKTSTNVEEAFMTMTAEE